MPRARVYVEQVPAESSPEQVAHGIAKLFASFDLPGLFGGKRVLVKPNLCGDQLPGNTDPRVIYGVVRALEPFAARIVVGDGSIIGVETASVIEELGLPELLRNTRAEIIDFKSGKYLETALPAGGILQRITLAEEAANAEAIISVAKLKIHDATGVSLSIKNLKGMLHEFDNLHFHHMNLCDCLAELVSAIRPTLSVVDGIYGFDIHDTGAVPLGVVMAGEDPVAVNATAARAIGVDPASIYSDTLNESHIKRAAERGVGEIDDIEVVGSLPRGFRLTANKAEPDTDSGRHRDHRWRPLRRMHRHARERFAEAEPRRGQGKEDDYPGRPQRPPPDQQTPGRTIIIGNCLHRLKSDNENSMFVIGCPPNGTYDVLPILEA